MTAKEQNGGGAVKRDICLRSIDDEREIEIGQHLLDERLSKLPLHEIVSGDNPDKPIVDCELEAALREWRAQGVFPVGRDVPLFFAEFFPVVVLAGGILFCDVRGIGNDGVELRRKHLLERGANI